MRVKIKGTALETKKSRYNRYLLIVALLCAAFISAPFSPVSAQENKKPELVEIILDEESSDQEAKNIVKSLITRNSSASLANEDFKAKFIPIEELDTDNKYIFAIFEDSEFGGCHARGCMTAIYRNTGNNEWAAVFAAYVIHSYYDKASITGKKPANLIFSSNMDRSNPGVWMWNGKEYIIVNKQS